MHNLLILKQRTLPHKDTIMIKKYLNSILSYTLAASMLHSHALLGIRGVTRPVSPVTQQRRIAELAREQQFNQPHGLGQAGNTCYLNGAFQALLACHDVTKYIATSTDFKNRAESEFKTASAEHLSNAAKLQTLETERKQKTEEQRSLRLKYRTEEAIPQVLFKLEVELLNALASIYDRSSNEYKKIEAEVKAIADIKTSKVEAQMEKTLAAALAQCPEEKQAALRTAWSSIEGATGFNIKSLDTRIDTHLKNNITNSEPKYVALETRLAQIAKDTRDLDKKKATYRLYGMLTTYAGLVQNYINRSASESISGNQMKNYTTKIQEYANVRAGEQGDPGDMLNTLLGALRTDSILKNELQIDLQQIVKKDSDATKKNEENLPSSLLTLNAFDESGRPIEGMTQALARYFAPEPKNVTFEGESTPSPATKTFQITKLPHYLCLQAVIISTDNFGERIRAPKFTFPVELALKNEWLKNSIAPEQKYKLQSIVLHSGGGDLGHYIALARYGEEWYELNDSSVTRISAQKVKEAGAAGKYYQGTYQFTPTFFFYEKI